MDARLEMGAGSGGWRGSRLVLGSLGLFVGPLVLAVAGAVLAGEQPTSRFLGGVVGLATGIGLSILVSFILKHRASRGAA